MAAGDDSENSGTSSGTLSTFCTNKVIEWMRLKSETNSGIDNNSRGQKKMVVCTVIVSGHESEDTLRSGTG